MNQISDDLAGLKLRAFLSEIKAGPAALWILCFYFLTEYIRPQTMYPVLDILPWSMLSLLACTASIFMAKSVTSIRFLAIDRLFILMSLIVLLSAVFAWKSSVSLEYWSTYTSWLLMYFSVIYIVNSPRKVLLFFIFFILINFKLSQYGARTFAMRGFSFAHWGLSGSPGWFRNSGEFAMQMAVIFSISTCLLLALKSRIQSKRRWWLLVFLFPCTSALSVIGSSSRGGQIALAAVVLILIFQGKNFLKKLLVLSVVVYAVITFLPEEQKERFNTMGDDKTSQLRLIHWSHAMETINNEPLGIGYFNWRSYYPAKFDVEKYEEIHNTALQAFVELGYHGGILFLVMIAVTLAMNHRTRKLMGESDSNDAVVLGALAFGTSLSLISTLIAAMFMSVLYYPVFWVNFALSSAIHRIAINLEQTADVPAEQNVTKQRTRKPHPAFQNL